MTSPSDSATIASREPRELIPPDSPLAPYISVDPGRMHGEPCFTGSRVPIQILFDHLRAGDGMAVFLEDFPPAGRRRHRPDGNGFASGVANL